MDPRACKDPVDLVVLVVLVVPVDRSVIQDPEDPWGNEVPRGKEELEEIKDHKECPVF